VDYLLGRFVGQPQDFLKTMSWYEANEERRRYFFEHDGDYRYSGGWLKRLLRGSLFPSKTEMPEAGGGEPRAERKEEDNWERDAGGKKEQVGQAPPRTAPRLVTPWQILGVKANASPEEIRVAFHKLAVQYHPDKVHHMGEDFQKVAHEKFLELQKAYNRLTSRSP
jgi:DnaJ-domain-containing protein 1